MEKQLTAITGLKKDEYRGEDVISFMD